MCYDLQNKVHSNHSKSRYNLFTEKFTTITDCLIGIVIQKNKLELKVYTLHHMHEKKRKKKTFIKEDNQLHILVISLQYFESLRK